MQKMKNDTKKCLLQNKYAYIPYTQTHKTKRTKESALPHLQAHTPTTV